MFKKYNVRLLICLISASICLFSTQTLAVNYVTIDSLTGKAEMQKAEQGSWTLVKKGQKLSDNDVLRVLDSSMAVLAWPGSGSNIMYVHAQSQLRINLYANTQANSITKHVTVFAGAIYFVIKKTLPKSIFASDNIKIYSPTAVVALRGTSVCVNVDKQNGTTDIQLINGTVLVRNILKNVSSFLSAGYKTTVAINTDPIVPAALLTSDIDALKSWVPSAVILRDMAEQIEQAKRDHYVMTGKFDDKIIIASFFNTTKYNGPWNIGKSMAEMIAHQLEVSVHNFSVETADIPDTSLFAQAAAKKARYVISAIIDKFEIVQHAEVSPRADEYKEFFVAQIHLTLQLIDVAEKKMICEQECTGEMTGKNLPQNSWTTLSKLPFNLDNEKFAGSIMGEAVRQTTEQATSVVVHALGN